MSKRLLAVAVFLTVAVSWCSGANAQNAIVIPNCDTAAPSTGVQTLYMDANGNLCTASVPATVSGFGVLSATNSSVALSTVTPNAGGAVFPTKANMIYIKNVAASGGTFYVCPFGGTCTSATGIAIEAGTSYGFNMKLPGNMTGISASTSTVDIQW